MKRCFNFDHLLDSDIAVVMSRGVHRSEVISAVRTQVIDGYD